MIKIEQKIVSVALAEKGATIDATAVSPLEIRQGPETLLERGDGPLHGVTYKIKPGDRPSLYVTLNYIEDDDQNRLPFEIFINGRDPGLRTWRDVVTRMTSSNFRYGGSFDHIIEDFKSSVDAEGYWSGGRYYAGVVCHLGYLIEQWLRLLGDHNYGDSTEAQKAAEPSTGSVSSGHPVGPPEMPKCPTCGEYALKKEGGCEQCLSCNYSKCG